MKLQCHLIVGIFYLKSEKSEKTKYKILSKSFVWPLFSSLNNGSLVSPCDRY